MRTDKGNFAPPGGKSLAPRQFERQWRGGRPNDLNLAGMAAEYRGKFAGKAVICDFDSANWAWVCAGGSLPRLPRTTDKNLLAAIPQMQPWVADSEKKLWALSEPGKQFLICGSSGAELDLSAESGVFALHFIDPRSGLVSDQSQINQAGGKRIMPGGIVWLTK